MFVFGAIHMLATELIPARRSRGEILLFKKPSRAKRAGTRHDQEVGNLASFSQDNHSDNSAIRLYEVTPEVRAKGRASSERTQVQSSIFHWSDLSYEIKTGKNDTRRILNSIDGWVQPGTLTALMVCLSIFTLSFCLTTL